MDYLPEQGYLLRSDLYSRLNELGAEILPLYYDLNRAKSLLKEVDGILLPGSRYDLQPKTYGEEIQFSNVLVNPVREEFELQLFGEVLKTELPVLGICWGFQLINVFLGGSLYQDLPAQFKSNIDHEQKFPSTQPAHGVSFLNAARAKEIFGTGQLQVNSTHHQGIKVLADSLNAEAESPDGLIEAFSFPEKKFFWGVEWHPERLKDDPIIPSFLKACRH